MREAVLRAGQDSEGRPVTFTVRTKGRGIFTKRWILNGKPVAGTSIRREDILRGGVLEAELTK